MIEITQKFKSV